MHRQVRQEYLENIPMAEYIQMMRRVTSERTITVVERRETIELYWSQWNPIRTDSDPVPRLDAGRDRSVRRHGERNRP